MTQLNINVMDSIVNNLAAGKTISAALKAVYKTRNVAIPFDDKFKNVSIDKLDISAPVRNTLKRAHLYTIGDIMKFGESIGIQRIRGMGATKGMQMMESILNYAWNHMSMNERTEFLIDTVERNTEHIDYEAL